MRQWLALAAVLPLTASGAAHAQMKGLAAPVVASVAKSHQLDLRMSQQQGNARPMPLIGGMLAQRDVAPNAYFGLGLANMYSRKKGGDARITDAPRAAKKPAVTFVVRF
jgi:hypothetical protein